MATVTRSQAPSRPQGHRDEVSPGTVSDLELNGWVRQILNRRPAVGMAVGIVRNGRRDFFRAHGLADIATHAPITEDTIFRIGSITKLFTAIAVMQLWERGLVDLDGPASKYLRAYKLIGSEASWRPVSLRHLLTHTAGIPEVRGAADLLHADLTPDGGRPALGSVRAGEPMPQLAEYYREGLRIVVEPGTAFAYTNHGFATLGQIIEDVSGMPLERYLRDRIFDPLGMADTDVIRSERVKSRLATGYVLGRAGPRAVPDREWIGAGAGNIYSTPRDMARFVAALLGGGASEHGRILEPATLATMFEPHYQPDPRMPGVGLAFFRGEVGGHPVVGHDGILPGFNSAVAIAPNDGIGVLAFTNGSSGAFSWLQLELHRLMRPLLGVSKASGPGEAPQQPEIWSELCGRYVLPPRIADLRGRLMLGGGAEVFVRGGRLMVRLLTPVPTLRRGLPLEPDDERDPSVFRLDLTRFGMPSVRVLFGREPRGRATTLHSDLGGQPLSLFRRQDAGVRRRWLKLALGALAAGLLVGVRRNPRRSGRIGMSLDQQRALDRLMLRARRRWLRYTGILSVIASTPLRDRRAAWRLVGWGMRGSARRNNT